MSEELKFPKEEEAFKRVRENLTDVVPVDQPVTTNMELVGQFSRTAMRICWPHREELYATLNFNREDLDELVFRGLALKYVARRWRLVSMPDGTYEIQVMKPRAKQLRKGLILAGQTVYTLSENRTEAEYCLKIIGGIIKGRMSYKEISKDLLDLVLFWRDRESVYTAQTPITPELLAEAEELGEFFGTLKEIENAKVTSDLEDTHTLMMKAYTYYAKSYNEVRRACVSSLFYKGGENMLPKLQATGRSPKAQVAPSKDASAPSE